MKGCGKPIDIQDQIDDLLKVDNAVKWREMKAKASNLACPDPGCGQPIRLHYVDHNLHSASCIACHRKFCTWCRAPPHKTPSDCPSVRSVMADDDVTVLETLGCKRCGSCGYMVENALLDNTKIL